MRSRVAEAVCCGHQTRAVGYRRRSGHTVHPDAHHVLGHRYYLPFHHRLAPGLRLFPVLHLYFRRVRLHALALLLLDAPLLAQAPARSSRRPHHLFFV